MMKKFILFAIIVVLLIPIGSSAETKHQELDVLYTIMDSLQGQTNEEETIFNGIILDRFIDTEEMEAIGDMIVSKLGLIGLESDPNTSNNLKSGYYTKEVKAEENFRSIHYMGQDKYKNNIIIILTSYNYEEELTGDTYLCINLVKNSDFLAKNDIIEEVKSIYTMYNSNVDIVFCLLGEISNDIVYNRLEEDIKTSLKRIDGEIINEFSDIYMISYTGYTPFIDNYKEVGSDKINLNIAIRYGDNKNVVWIGTPIITVGY